MSAPKPSIADARNASVVTSEQYRILQAALNGDRFEHGPGASRIRRKTSKAAAEIEKAAGEELAGAFLTAGSSKFSEALAEAAFSTLGGSRGRAALAAVPELISRQVQAPEIAVIVAPKPSRVRRNGITVPMLMAVVAGELRRDAIHFRFTAAKASHAVREGIRTLAAQHLLARAMGGTKRFIAGVSKKALPLAIGLSLAGTAVMGNEASVHLSFQDGMFASSYQQLAAENPAADAAEWAFPITISAPTIGFVGAESDQPAPPTRGFLELAHKALSITLKDNVLAAHQIERMVDAMESCATRNQRCKVESLGVSMDQANGHHTLRLLPSAGYSLYREQLAFEYRATGVVQEDAADYVEKVYEEMYPAVDSSLTY